MILSRCYYLVSELPVTNILYFLNISKSEYAEFLGHVKKSLSFEHFSFHTKILELLKFFSKNCEAYRYLPNFFTA